MQLFHRLLNKMQILHWKDYIKKITNSKSPAVLTENNQIAICNWFNFLQWREYHKTKITWRWKRKLSHSDLSFTLYLLSSVKLKSNVRNFTTRGNCNFAAHFQSYIVPVKNTNCSPFISTTLRLFWTSSTYPNEIIAIICQVYVCWTLVTHFLSFMLNAYELFIFLLGIICNI